MPEADEQAQAAAHGLPAPPRDLTEVECRVLGSLIEKDRTTPQNYPLTLNALRVACNQSTNRDPVVDYDDRTIEAALGSLRERGLTRIVYSPTNRATKYRHVLDEHLRLTPAELALLGVLLLRGPQTVGELKSRAERGHGFGDLAEAQATVDGLISRPAGPLVVRLDRRPGQKDARYRHLLAPLDGGADVTPAPAPDSEPVATNPEPTAPFGSPAARPDRASAPTAAPTPPPVATAAPSPGPAPLGPDQADLLLAEIARLEGELAQLRAEFEQFRAAFDAP